MDSGKRFDPTRYLRTIKVRGGGQQPYLPVTARLLWLRAEHPDAHVITEALRLDDKGAVFKATVTLPGGGVAVGHGSETAGDFGDFIEKAETKAIGRALAALGYGTEFAETQDDPTLAAATEVAPIVTPPPREPIALPATTTPAAPLPIRSERPARQEPAERTERPPRQYDQPERPSRQPEQPERLSRQPEPPERSERSARQPEQPERLARQQESVERPERADRFTPTPRGYDTARPTRPERIERPERSVPAEEPPRVAPVERPLRPERLSRLRDTAPPAPEPAAAPIAEAAPPTPIRRSGRTLTGRTPAPPPAAPVPEPEAPRAAAPAEEAAAGEDDDIEMAMISTTSFWRWARGKGYPDRAAVEAAIGKSMEAMTPREAYYRLKEVLAREGSG